MYSCLLTPRMMIVVDMLEINSSLFLVRTDEKIDVFPGVGEPMTEKRRILWPITITTYFYGKLQYKIETPALLAAVCL
jgi:hypothetical protein